MRPNMSKANYKSSVSANMELLLQEVNSQEVLSLYPLLFFYSTILIIGILGNALVLLVYSFRYRRSPARVYILFLAAIDFLMCSFGLPYHLIDMTHPYTYTNATACKILTFLITTLFHMSIFGLIVIAIDRYLKICKPLGKMQIAYFGKKRACGAAILGSLLMSWPNIVLYGPSEMESPDGNITGYACFFETSYLETNYPFIYTMSTLCICLGSTLFLIVSYSLIVHKICTRFKCNTVKLKGRSVFDDTTLTETICFKNWNLPSQEKQININETRFSRSIEELCKYRQGTSKCSETGKCPSPNDSLNSCNERLVICNSNGSLTFVGNENRKYSSSAEDNSYQQTDMGDTKIPLLGPGSYHNAKLRSEKTSLSKSLDIGLDQKGIHSTCYKEALKHGVKPDMNTGSLLSLRNTQCRTTDPFCRTLNQSPIAAENMLGHRKDGRYSLQVPILVTPASNRISFRRTSDITGEHSNRIVQQWKQCSSIALGNIKRNNIFQEEGLRINNSSHSVNLSSQGTFKVKKTVTKQHSKITKIMLTITIIFVLSYSPALVVTIWTAVQPELWDILDEKETIVCEFLLRFYLINNICNPFIYGFWDKRFKREIIYTFRKISVSMTDRLLCCTQKKTGSYKL